MAAAAAVAVVLLVMVAALVGVSAQKRLVHPSFEKTASAVATWTPCTGVNPWELSKLEDGDIFTTNVTDRTIYADRKWENRTVAFLIEMTHFAREEIAEIRETVRRMNELSCVKFWEADSYATDYVRITGKDEGCYSEYWGRKGGMQIVNLQTKACLQRGTIFHELLHTLGFLHMHSSPIRNDYIRVIYKNIEKEDHKHFATYDSSYNNTDFGLPYDYDSLMHFSRRAHSTNGRDTIETHDVAATIGRRQAPSFRDVSKIKLLYDC